ncbi:MAG: hypothetical protein KAS73_04010 [Candidatus Sabulitectum sp.]|nr:hypothetical protein [Candidatus Sabulitectum sp.]
MLFSFSAVILFSVFQLSPEEASSITIPPGGYAWAVCSDSTGFSDIETVNTIAPGPLPGLSAVLPDSALQAVQLSAEWLRSDLAAKFTDLLYREVNNEMQSEATPAFADVNGDGLQDLVLEAGSGRRVLIAPFWTEITEVPEVLESGRSYDMNNDGSPDSSFMSHEGVLTIFSGDSILLRTEGFDLSAVTGSALGDMDGDGLADLVVCTEPGNVLVFRNIGTVETPCFLPFFQGTRTMFPMNPGAFSSPALFAQDDSTLVLAVGTRQDGLSFYSSGAVNDSPLRSWSAINTVQGGNCPLNISPVAVNLSGETVLVCGTRDGILYEAEPFSDSLVLLDLPPVPGTYPNLAVAFVNNDQFPDLVAGTMEGGVFFLPGLDGWFHGNWAGIEGIPSIPSGAPASHGNRLIFGTANGTILCFSKNESGEWVDSTEGSGFSLIDVGEYSTPYLFDLDGDGHEELAVGNSTGSTDLYEQSIDGSDNFFFESFSWGFEPNGGVVSIDSYYSRYFTPYSVLRCPSGVSTVNAFAAVIISADLRYRDEIAYCIANTPTDVLLAMEDNGDIDLLTVNARNVYDSAENLSYVRLLDSEDGTVCELRTAEGWFEISRENYYRFVVHPRILFEIPGRIDATYWNTPWDTLALSEREYLNFQPDSLYGDTPDHLFWREFIPADSSRGRTLEQRMAGAETYGEAVVRLCNFQSHSQPGGLMSFGYMTNDLQPLTIYSKAYGSCGEQSILQTALCRAFFIPAYVVGCRGEDHQWNQYLDPASERWNHWDINYGISGIGNLWVSGEGVDHKGKTISTITAFGPEGRLWGVTESVLAPEGSGYMQGDSGYTRTARVEVSVTDSGGIPVGGAMVLVRSHWENANSVTAFDYTDDLGECTFLLGWEPNGGYTFDIISAFGSTGSSNTGFTEDSLYVLNYIVPCAVPQRQAVALPGSGQTVPVTESLYPVPYFTGSLYSIGSENEDFLHNTDWIPWRQEVSTGEVYYMDGRNFRDYRNGLNCSAVGDPFIPVTGDSCYAVLDNRNSMFTWREWEFTIPGSINPVSNRDQQWLDNRSTTRVPVAGLCIQESLISSEDSSSRWIRSYLNMDIQQDDPDDPLSSSVVIGPFRVPAGERSMSIETASIQPGLDLDLFLFMDRNGNRIVDGMSELHTRSASPTSSELISLTEPDPSEVFWIYLHGWKVEQDRGIIDMGLSFEPEMLSVHSLSPTGYQKTLPETFSFSTEETYSAGDIYLQSGETVIYPEKQQDFWRFEPASASEFFADSTVKLLESGGDLIEELQWIFMLDSVLPEFSIHSDGMDHSTMQGVVEVTCEDDLSGVAGVTLTVDSLESQKLVLRGDTLWNCTVDFLPFQGETVSIEICAVDSAGNETRESFEMSSVSRPEVVFSSIYPTGTVYDHTPVLQVLADFENPVSGWTATAKLAGELLEPVIDGEMIQFLVNEFLPDGEHRVMVKIQGPDGEIIGEHGWVFTVGTMTVTS